MVGELRAVSFWKEVKPVITETVSHPTSVFSSTSIRWDAVCREPCAGAALLVYKFNHIDGSSRHDPHCPQDRIPYSGTPHPRLIHIVEVTTSIHKDIVVKEPVIGKCCFILWAFVY